jgi:hypothetical protein
MICHLRVISNLFVEAFEILVSLFPPIDLKAGEHVQMDIGVVLGEVLEYWH